MFDPIVPAVVVPVAVDWTPIAHEIVATVGSVVTLAVTAFAAYFANRTRIDREGTRHDRADARLHATRAKKSALYVEQSMRPPSERTHPHRRAADHPSNELWDNDKENEDPQP